MGVLSDENSINHAVEQLLTPQREQGEAEVPEQESPEEETLEAEDSGQDEAELVEEEEVGGEPEEDELLEEDETPESDEQSEDEFYNVKVDGEEFEVNLEELKKGYQLEKNYTKKTQALAEEKKELSNLKQQLEAERDKYLQVNAQIAQQANAELDKAKAELKTIDKNDDPIGYVQKQLEVQDIEANLKQRVSDYEAAQSRQQYANQEQMQSYLAEQAAILDKELEGWNDPTEGAAIKEGIMKFAQTVGYTAEELNSVSSAKDIIVLNKARLYDEMVAKRAVVKDKRTPRKAAPQIRSAAKKSGNVAKARVIKDKRSKLKSSGSVKDATSLMTDLMLRKPIRK